MIDQSTITAISTVGFPIVAYLLLYLDLRKILNRNTDVIKNLSVIIKANGR